MSMNNHTSRFLSVMAVSAVALSASHSGADRPGAATFANTWSGARTTYIVQAADSHEAYDSVRHVGAAAREDLEVIRAVAADLDDAQVAQLSANPRLRLYKDRSVSTRGLVGDTLDERSFPSSTARVLRPTRILKPTIPSSSARTCCIRAASRAAV